MIKFKNTEVFNFEGALRGMRNPLNSWDKSDSEFIPWDISDFEIGPNDLALAQRLIKAGTDHRKFLRQIIVNVDITAPLYWWKEFDTYKVGTVANSCSTMHKIHAKEFTIDDFSTDHLMNVDSSNIWYIIDELNADRAAYIKTKDKDYWYDMIQLLPSSYNQLRTVTLNYEVLANIYKSRKDHKLDEWSVGFINWIESLPYANELIIGG